MAFPEIAYPDPGWVSRFVGRREQAEIVEKILDSTHRGVTLPIIQVIGEEGVGKSWFLQYLNYRWRDRVDVPVIILRISNPAMSQWDKAIDALYSRMINRWRAILPLTEFVLGRIAHLRGEKFERYTTYSTSVKYLHFLEKPKGEYELRRILVEHGVDVFRKIWGSNWGNKFLAKSPQELAWNLWEVFGVDIDQALRNIGMRGLVLMVDDIDLNPATYFNILSVKAYSSLTLFITTMKNSYPTGGIPLEIIPLEPLSLLERKAYLYSLGIEKRISQRKIERKQCYTSIDYPIGVIKFKKIIEKDESLLKVLEALIVTHRPSLDVIRQLVGGTEGIKFFLSEPALVDLIEKPDRIPWRFLIHSRAKKWILSILNRITRYEETYGDELNRLTIFANTDFNSGMPMLYWYLRNAVSRWDLGSAIDGIFAADEVSENSNHKEFKLYNRYILLDIMRPTFNREKLLKFARMRLLWRQHDDETIDLLISAKCFLVAGRNQSARIIAEYVLRVFSSMVLDSGGRNPAAVLLRAEANRILGMAQANLGDLTQSEVTLSRAVEATISTFGMSTALADEALLLKIRILKDLSTIHCRMEQYDKAWNYARNAIELAFGLLSGAEYRVIPIMNRIFEIFSFIMEQRLWIYSKIEVLNWLKRVQDICENNWRIPGVETIGITLANSLLYNSKLLLNFDEYEASQKYTTRFEKLLPELGEMFHWRAKLWRKLSLKQKLIKSEICSGLGNPKDSLELATEVVEIIDLWNLAEIEPEYLAKARIIGGLSLARLEKFDNSIVWLEEGTQLCENIIENNPSNPNFLEIYALCSDAYHEMTRIELHQRKYQLAVEHAKRGIEIRRLLINLTSSPELYIHTAELYTLLLEALKSLKEYSVIAEKFDDTIKIILDGCLLLGDERKRCIRIAEDLFKFGLELISEPQWRSKPENLLLLLSLYPLLNRQELKYAANDIIRNLEKAEMSEELCNRLGQVKELIDGDTK